MRVLAWRRILASFALMAFPIALTAEDAVTIREIRVSGVTAFPKSEIEKITHPLEGKSATFEDLEAVRQAITLKYVQAGFLNSGALLADPPVVDGIARIDVIEGTLTRVEVEGNRWVRDSYFQRRLHAAAGTPLQVQPLQQRLQMFTVDGQITRFNADLLPGAERGQSVLRVRVNEAFPIRVFLTYDNYQSDSVGAQRGQITITDQNLTGFGDSLSVTYGRSSGVNPMIDAYYTVPLTSRDTTLTLGYRRNGFLVVEEIFQALDISSRSESYSIGLRHPLIRRLNREFAIGVAGERLKNDTSLLGEPFSFSQGALNGRSVISVLRVFQEYTVRSQKQVITARSRFSVGLNALGSTIHKEPAANGIRPADSRFFSWLGQVQWARRLAHESQVIARADWQQANDALLPLEQLPVGGRFSVRGYRENQFVRDNGVIASVEGRLPILRRGHWPGRIEAAAFFDFGRAWNNNFPSAGEKNLASGGPGLRWAGPVPENRGLQPFAEFYWGVPFNRIDIPGGRHTLQDKGIHFQLGLSMP